VEDSNDLDDFLQKDSSSRFSKQPKLLFFDENLLAPLYLKKLAVNLDGRITIGVSDNHQIVKKFNANF
jgi:hypothetical protein